MIKNNFAKMNVQYLTKTDIERKTKPEESSLKTEGTNSTDTSSKQIDLKKNDQASLEIIKENTKQIKSLTEELKKLKIPTNATKDDINNFITQVNTMRKQVGELYHQATQTVLSTKYPEKDNLVFAYQEFNSLALSKIEGANFSLDILKGIYRPMPNQGKDTQVE